MNRSVSAVRPVLEDFYLAQTGSNFSVYLTQVAAGGAPAYLSGSVPFDFLALESMYVLLISTNNQAADLTVIQFYAGTAGDAAQLKSAAGPVLVNYVANQIIAVECTVWFRAITVAAEPGDIFGITATPQNKIQLDVVGTRMLYRPRTAVQ